MLIIQNTGVRKEGMQILEELWPLQDLRLTLTFYKVHILMI